MGTFESLRSAELTAEAKLGAFGTEGTLRRDKHRKASFLVFEQDILVLPRSGKFLT